MGSPFLEHHNAWASEHSSNGNFGVPILRVKPGTIQFRVLDDVPTSRMVHYKSVGTRPVICPESECLFCARGDEKTTQHYLNVVDRADNKVKVLVYSQAASEEISSLVQRVAEKSGTTTHNDPKYYDISLTRTGADRQSTRYKAVAIGKEFSPESYTRVNLNEKLAPMTVEEQKTKTKTNQDDLSTKISERGLRSWAGPPPSSVVKTPEVKTVIKDDDKEEI